MKFYENNTITNELFHLEVKISIYLLGLKECLKLVLFVSIKSYQFSGKLQLPENERVPKYERVYRSYSGIHASAAYSYVVSIAKFLSHFKWCTPALPKSPK